MAYTDFMLVPTVSGPIASQRAVAQAIIDAEENPAAQDDVVRFIFSWDSRLTDPAGAGIDMAPALRVGLASLTSHGHIPESGFRVSCGVTLASRDPYLGFNRLTVSVTGLTTTTARKVPQFGTDTPCKFPTHAAGVGVLYGMDYQAEWVAAQLRCKGVAKWDTTATSRFRFYHATNPTNSSSVFWFLYSKDDGATGHVMSFTGATNRASGTYGDVGLQSGTYAIINHATSYIDLSTRRYWMAVVTSDSSGGAGGVETVGGRWESNDRSGIATYILANGGYMVTSLMAAHPDSGAMIQAAGPYRVGVIACGANDAYLGAGVSAVTWETNLTQAITDLRTLCGNATLPIIVWSPVERVNGTADAAKAIQHNQYPGVAQTVANAMTNVIAVNTMKTIRQKWFDYAINWVPGGNLVVNLTKIAANLVGDVGKWTTDAAVPGFDVLGDNHWYKCIIATNVGDTPGTQPTKFFRIDAEYDAAVTYQPGYCCLRANRSWAFTGPVAAAASEPGVSTDWTEMTIYPPYEYIHPHSAGAQLIVDEFIKALKELPGVENGYDQGNTDGYNTGYSDGVVAGGGGGGGGNGQRRPI